MKWAVVSRRYGKYDQSRIRPPPEVRLFKTFESAAKYATGIIETYLKDYKHSYSKDYESVQDFIMKNYDHENNWRGISRFETNEGEFFIEKVKLEPQEVGK
tara:strand:+ start:3985 stop:4287 length:303 start_codon:yes stop_codon:yes gene_type:complete